MHGRRTRFLLPWPETAPKGPETAPKHTTIACSQAARSRECAAGLARNLMAGLGHELEWAAELGRARAGAGGAQVGRWTLPWELERDLDADWRRAAF